MDLGESDFSEILVRFKNTHTHISVFSQQQFEGCFLFLLVAETKQSE